MLLGLVLSISFTARARQQRGQAPTFGTHAVTPKPEDVKLKPSDSAPLAGIRIRVKDAEGKPIARKRFYLLAKSVEQSAPDWPSVPARDSFLTGASPELREWLKRHDCDTLYCPEYEAAFEAGKEAVPELKLAYAEGMKKYRSPWLALRWMTVNFPLKESRLSYYEAKKGWLARASLAAGLVSSVMTDERGEAYFVGVRPGPYFVSNLIPLEKGNVVWSAPVTVPPLPPGKLHSASVELIAKPR